MVVVCGTSVSATISGNSSEEFTEIDDVSVREYSAVVGTVDVPSGNDCVTSLCHDDLAACAADGDATFACCVCGHVL